MKVPIVYCQFNRSTWMGVKVRKLKIKKLAGSRKAIGVIKCLSGDDYISVYSHF